MYETKTQIASLSDGEACIACVGVKHHAVHGMTLSTTDVVQRESVLNVNVDGRSSCALCCSLDHPVELAAGHLLAEGVIRSLSDVEEISLDASGQTVHVRLSDVARAGARPDCPVTRKEESSSERPGRCKPFGTVCWTESWVDMVAREFAKDKTSHARTRGCHSAYLANRDGILCMREDIGRHNAFDKVVGWALLHGVDRSACLLYTSGRVPTEMVLKAIRSRIPILVSKSVTTDKAIEIANAAGLVLLCEARPGSFLRLSGNAPQPESAFELAI